MIEYGIEAGAPYYMRPREYSSAGRGPRFNPIDKAAARLIISRPGIINPRRRERLKQEEARMDGALSGALIGALVGMVVVTIGLIVAATRKGASAVKNRPKKILAFIAPMPPAEVMKSVIRYGQQSGYRIDDIANPGWRIILSEKPSFTTWGFFYPVYMTANQQGGTLVEVGIKSRFIQMGPIVTRKHEECFNGIRAAIFANS
jgi:hypothetical protein